MLVELAPSDNQAHSFFTRMVRPSQAGLGSSGRCLLCHSGLRDGNAATNRPKIELALSYHEIGSKFRSSSSHLAPLGRQKMCNISKLNNLFPLSDWLPTTSGRSDL